MLSRYGISEKPFFKDPQPSDQGLINIKFFICLINFRPFMMKTLVGTLKNVLFHFSQHNQATLGRVSSRKAWVLFFVRDNVFQKFPRGRWRCGWEGGKLTKGQFILLTLIKSYVPSCSIFQLFEITFLLLFVFFGFSGFMYISRAPWKNIVE